jgi:alpha-L-fucosidase 2
MMKSFLKQGVFAFLAVFMAAFLSAAEPRTPTRDGIVYGTADGQTLTMDYYAAKGDGVHPIVIVIHGGGYHGGNSKNDSEAYVVDFLAPAGYAVFSINYRVAPKYPYPYMVLDAQRAVRFIRYHAKEWNADPDRIALVGGSAGGFLSNMVGLKNDGGDPNAPDPVDRVSARAQAVVSLFAQSSFEFVPLNADVHRFLDPLIAQKGLKAAIREASPITYVSPDDPPFLEILGDQDEYIPFAEAVNLQTALHKAGVRCDVIKIPGGKHGTGGWNKISGVPDWEREMTEWLNARLHHQGPIGEGIRARVATAAQ